MDDQELLMQIAALADIDPSTRQGIGARASLAAILAVRPEFFTPQRAVVNINGAHGFTPHFAAARMLKVARDTGNSNFAMDWIRKVSAATQAKGGAVSALYGVTCHKEIRFSDNLMLLPYLDLPPSPTRDFVLHRERSEFDGTPRRPTAALYRTGTVNPLFVAENADLEGVQPALWYEEIIDATRLLTLIPRTVPREAAHWMHYDDPDIELLGVSGISQYTSELDPRAIRTPDAVTDEGISGLLLAFRSLSGKDKDRVVLAIERINRARCQYRDGNRAIDLAIALEVLFMNADSGEHSYKISLRAARFLFEDRESRLRVFSHVRKLYDIRSKMVHTGMTSHQLTVGKIQRSTYELLEHVDGVCTQAIRQILARGSIPHDWSDIEL
jgi:hypothetical protein